MPLLATSAMREVVMYSALGLICAAVLSFMSFLHWLSGQPCEPLMVSWLKLSSKDPMLWAFSTLPSHFCATTQSLL
ncbi:cytochrome b [Mycolicibacterium canariasense]|uniref:Cytochrome b n=1 Tax=Mycolicibacterium canariasense TaxID=228230 RepID=A0A117I968_MYCCR|nr:cytochrome b [Mycolicibacterium canariasense]